MFVCVSVCGRVCQFFFFFFLFFVDRKAADLIASACCQNINANLFVSRYFCGFFLLGFELLIPLCLFARASSVTNETLRYYLSRSGRPMTIHHKGSLILTGLTSCCFCLIIWKLVGNQSRSPVVSMLTVSRLTIY